MARRPRSIGRYLERLALAAAFLLVTGTMLHAVRGYEQTLSGGRMVLVELAPVDFFFQEGTAERARWGEFRVSADGKALLRHLRDEALEQLE